MITKKKVETNASIKLNFFHKEIKKTMIFLFFSFLIFNSHLLFSQTENTPPPQPRTIVIYGNIPKNESTTTGSVSTISKKEIRQSGCQDAGDIIKKHPGNLLNTNGARSSISTVSIRGSRSSQVLILVNGEKMNSASGIGGNDPTKIPADQIERIEIYRGAAAAWYGSGATAGVVNIITRIEKKNLGSIKYLYDSINGHDINFSFNFLAPEQESKISIGGEILYNPIDLNIIGGDIITNHYLGLLNFEYRLNRKKYNIHFQTITDENHTTEQVGNKLNLTSNLTQLNWKLKRLKDLPLNYNGSASLRIFDLIWIPNIMPAADKSRSFSVEINNGIQYQTYKENYNFLFNGKASYNAEMLQSSVFGFKHRHVISPAISGEVQFNNKTGKRKIGIFDFTSRLDLIIGNKIVAFPAINIGLLFYLDAKKRTILKTSLGNAFRAPALSELYYSSSSAKANPQLKGEKNISFDAGFLFKPIPFVELGAIYFLREEFRSIIWTGPRSENFIDTHFNGLELWLKLFFIVDPDLELSINNYYMYTDARNNKNTPFDLVHPHILKNLINLSYKNNFSLFMEINYYHGFKDITPFIEMNIKSQFRLREFSILIGINNLLEDKLRFHNYTTITPRGIQVSIKYEGSWKKKTKKKLL